MNAPAPTELLKLANEAKQLLNAKYAGDMSIAGAWHFLQRVEPALRQAASVERADLARAALAPEQD